MTILIRKSLGEALKSERLKRMNIENYWEPLNEFEIVKSHAWRKRIPANSHTQKKYGNFTVFLHISFIEINVKDLYVCMLGQHYLLYRIYRNIQDL